MNYLTVDIEERLLIDNDDNCVLFTTISDGIEEAKEKRK
jgi:hypothetical protein